MANELDFDLVCFSNANATGSLNFVQLAVFQREIVCRMDIVLCIEVESIDELLSDSSLPESIHL